MHISHAPPTYVTCPSYLVPHLRLPGACQRPLGQLIRGKQMEDTEKRGHQRSKQVDVLVSTTAAGDGSGTDFWQWWCSCCNI